jgi:hypothetical protein
MALILKRADRSRMSALRGKADLADPEADCKHAAIMF